MRRALKVLFLKIVVIVSEICLKVVQFIFETKHRVNSNINAYLTYILTNIPPTQACILCTLDTQFVYIRNCYELETPEQSKHFQPPLVSNPGLSLYMQKP